MSKYQDLPVSLLSTLLRYDPDTGHLFWLPRPLSMFQDHGGRYTSEWCQSNFNNKHAGKQAFTAIDNGGYHSGGIFGKTYSAHRVAWALHYGQWPTQVLDHINRIRTDNRVINLRQASGALNSHNKTPSRRSSPYVGVTYYKPTDKWAARIAKDREIYFLGYFVCPVEAAKVRDAKARELYGDDAVQNFSAG
jgi:hypothetical protein